MGKFVQAYIIKDEKLIKLEGYEVTKEGDVCKKPYKDAEGKMRKRKILKPTKIHGYMRLNVKLDGKKITVAVHRIVASTFLITHSLNLEVNHIDGNKANNKINNLEWVDHNTNMNHAVDNNLFPKNPKRKFSANEVKLIRKYHRDKQFTYKELAQLFQVPKSTIWGVISNRSYKEVK